MPNESFIGQDLSGWKPPLRPGVPSGAKSERVDFGQEQVRSDALAAFQREAATLLNDITRTKNMDNALEKISSDLASAIADADAKADPTLPRALALDGYRKMVDSAKSAALSRVRIIAEDFWNKFDA